MKSRCVDLKSHKFQKPASVKLHQSDRFTYLPPIDATQTSNMKSIEQNDIILASSEESKEMMQIDIGNEDNEENMKAKRTETADYTSESSDEEMASKDEGEDDQAEKETNKSKVDAGEKMDQSWSQIFLRRLLAFYLMYDFPIHILFCIGIAKAYPPLGAEHLEPKITAGWIATGIIFFLSGLGLKTGEFLKVVFRRYLFNAFVEGFNFGVVSLIVFGATRALAASGVLPQPLADGLAIAACLPMSINAVIILTTAAHGDEAAAIFHCTFGNICGIFLSPVLIVAYLPSVTADVNLPEVFLDLTKKVIVPLICGQLVHIAFKLVREFYFAHKKIFKKVQETSLVYIVFTVFSRKFNKNEEEEIGFGSIALVILFIFLIMTSCMALAWFSMKQLFPNQPKLRVMGLFGCTQKTIALGIPLILSIFGGTKYESLYTLPILIWHPMQLVVGSCVVGRLQKFVAEENERLGIVDDENKTGKASSAPNAQEPETADEQV